MFFFSYITKQHLVSEVSTYSTHAHSKAVKLVGAPVKVFARGLGILFCRGGRWGVRLVGEGVSVIYRPEGPRGVHEEHGSQAVYST